MRVLLRLALFLALIGVGMARAVSALAGAWPQEPGAWFVSNGLELGRDADLAAWGDPLPVRGWASLYVDYGLTRRLTVTLDYGRDYRRLILDNAPPAEQLYLIARWDLAPEARMRRALSFGIGKVPGGESLHLGFHLGRGFDSRFGSGWMNLDLSARGQVAGADLSLDGTLGLNHGEHIKIMLGVEYQRPASGEANLRLTPGVALDFGRMDLELRLLAVPSAPEESRVKLALWQRF